MYDVYCAGNLSSRTRQTIIEKCQELGVKVLNADARVTAEEEEEDDD